MPPTTFGSPSRCKSTCHFWIVETFNPKMESIFRVEAVLNTISKIFRLKNRHFRVQTGASRFYGPSTFIFGFQNALIRVGLIFGFQNALMRVGLTLALLPTPTFARSVCINVVPKNGRTKRKKWRKKEGRVKPCLFLPATAPAPGKGRAKHLVTTVAV